jgi:hypothetical protein
MIIIILRWFSEKFHNFHSSSSIIRMMKSRRMRWAGHVAQILLGKPEGNRLLGSPRRRWLHNIKMDLREIGCCGMV